VLVRSQTGDFHNMQEAAGMSTNLLDMREAWGEARLLTSQVKSTEHCHALISQ
jgi:hypothetical protein